MIKLVVCCFVLLPAVAWGQMAVGTWRDCLDNLNIYHVTVAGDRVYAAARTGLMCYDLEDNTLSGLSKAKGLNDAGIAAIAYDKQTRCLVVAYTNSNIDILKDDKIYNLSDIKRSEIPGDRSIYHIRFHGGLAYLATGFGVVVVDLGRNEIKETYYLGTNGGYTTVYDMAFMCDSIYAATAEGLKHVSVDEPNLFIADRWTVDHRFDGTTVTQLASVGGRLLAAGYTFDPNQFDLYRQTDVGYAPMLSGELRSMQVGGGRLAISIDNIVKAYDTNLVYLGQYTQFTWGEIDANDAVFSDDGSLWVAHQWGGLVQITPSDEHAYKLSNLASSDNVYRLVPSSNGVMLCPGGHTTTYANTYLEPNLFVSQGREWLSLDKSGGQLRDKYDVVDAAVNPRNSSETAIALWGGGVAIAKNLKVDTLFDENNTGGALNPYVVGSYSTLLTGAVTYDRNGNLWVLNSHQPYALAVRYANGTWEHFSTGVMATAPEVDKLIWDSINDYKWFCGRSNVIYVHDGKDRMARVDPNSGSKLKTETVNAIVQDHDGNIWIGTNKGIKVIYDGYKAFRNGGAGEYSPVTCSNITITNGEFAEYLMAYENITAIAVDGANRKWVGTAAGGLYLISPNGLDQLQHFTAANSPLFSDKVLAIGIQPSSGEVFVGTDKGLQVYRSTATNADAIPAEQVKVFPNPVRPDYEGPIAIKGFTRNGLVHITDASGHVVYSAMADGGQVVWNGRTHDGQRVASGVYYVFASDAEGGNRSVGKILIVR